MQDSPAHRRADRLSTMARVVNVLDGVIVVGVMVAVRFADAPSWLLAAAAPVVVLGVMVQARAFEVRRQAEEERAWRSGQAQWDREHRFPPS